MAINILNRASYCPSILKRMGKIEQRNLWQKTVSYRSFILTITEVVVNANDTCLEYVVNITMSSGL